MFQNIGNGAYKEGLETTLLIDSMLNHPHRNYRTIHVGGTNGKGSVSHTLAAVLQSAGYRVGLYTSPHLIDFSERIRVDGLPVSTAFVSSFVDSYKTFFESISPSFFEVTTAMAFSYFSEMKVDVAIIEVGLGGRLDCTNIISPDLSVITNISKDHTALLGDSLEKIAFEKAGIIKHSTPIVVGESHSDSSPLFLQKAHELSAPLLFADREKPIVSMGRTDDGRVCYETKDFSTFVAALRGECQHLNTATILVALSQLIKQGYSITQESVHVGFSDVCAMTGLRGRWDIIGSSPTVVCDTGHNEAGIRQIVSQLSTESFDTLRIVFGVVNDKDINSILLLLPRSATYYFCQASVPRSLPVAELRSKAETCGLHGNSFSTVAEAYTAAKADAVTTDLIYVGGSTFVVADLLRSIRH